jgi:hypothetical protein
MLRNRLFWGVFWVGSVSFPPSKSQNTGLFGVCGRPRSARARALVLVGAGWGVSGAYEGVGPAREGRALPAGQVRDSERARRPGGGVFMAAGRPSARSEARGAGSGGWWWRSGLGAVDGWYGR